MSKAGAAIVVPDSQFTGERLARILQESLASPAELDARASAARALARPGAAADIASLAEALMGTPRK